MCISEEILGCSGGHCRGVERLWREEGRAKRVRGRGEGCDEEGRGKNMGRGRC